MFSGGIQVHHLIYSNNRHKLSDIFLCVNQMPNLHHIQVELTVLPPTLFALLRISILFVAISPFGQNILIFACRIPAPILQDLPYTHPPLLPSFRVRI